MIASSYAVAQVDCCAGVAEVQVDTAEAASAVRGIDVSGCTTKA